MKRSCFFIFCCFVFLAGCSGKKEPLVIFHASTLALPLKELSAEFKKKHPDVEIITEASGSREAARKISELKRKADVLAVADYLVIRDLLMPEFADWYISFARNRMVICFTEQAQYGSQIDAANWFEILSRPGVRFGRVDPDKSPLGYRTLMTWQLADRYYKRQTAGKSIYDTLYEKCPPGNEFVRPEEMDLLPLLQNYTLDYCFDYLSVARQHNLKYIILPEEIDLSSPRFEQVYRNASVVLTGKEKGSFSTVQGGAIVYAVTIPFDAPHKARALQFVDFLLSDAGKKIVADNHQEPLSPAVAGDVSRVPPELKKYCGP